MRFIAAVSLLSLVLLAAPRPAAADERAPVQAQSSKSKGSHRTLWTIVGIGAGFTAGLFLGLNQFDDAINSERKVWISALAGAAAGGFAGNILSANQAPTTGIKTPKAPTGMDVRLKRLIARLRVEEP